MHNFSLVNPMPITHCPSSYRQPSFGLGGWPIVAALGLCSAQAIGQTVPDAGSLLRQTERNLSTPSTPTAPRREIKSFPPARPGETTVTVERFVFKGNTRLKEAQLQEAVSTFVGRPLTFLQLQQAAETVAGAFRESGWVVRAFLPQQEIEQGQVTIEIVEAVFGQTQITGEPSRRIQAEKLVRIVERAQPSGEALSATNIDRALILLDDLPGISVAGSLVEGDQEGQTNLNLTVTDESLITGSIHADNTGARSTGTDRLSANLTLNSPSRLGDSMALNLLKTQGSEYHRLAYTVPLGDEGLRGGLHYSNLNYTLIGDFAALGAKGVAQTAGIDITYPLLRSQTNNLQLALSYDSKTFDNTANAGNSNYGIKAYALTLSSTQFSANGSVTGLSATITTGEKSTETTYSKINFNFSRQQILDEGLSLLVTASWQLANKTLDSSEKIYLGGASGVRAYPSNEGGGSEGRTLTTELRQRLADRWTFVGFYDYGWALVNRSPSATPANPDSYALQGYGISLTWLGPEGLDLKATAAQRINSNPLQSAQGLDTDGSRKNTRLWFTASKAF
jgi:hemolysin activation/secretion protein